MEQMFPGGHPAGYSADDGTANRPVYPLDEEEDKGTSFWEHKEELNGSLNAAYPPYLDAGPQTKERALSGLRELAQTGSIL